MLSSERRLEGCIKGYHVLFQGIKCFKIIKIIVGLNLNEIFLEFNVFAGKWHSYTW